MDALKIMLRRRLNLSGLPEARTASSKAVLLERIRNSDRHYIIRMYSKLSTTAIDANNLVISQHIRNEEQRQQIVVEVKVRGITFAITKQEIKTLSSEKSLSQSVMNFLAALLQMRHFSNRL